MYLTSNSSSYLSIWRWLYWWEILCTHNIINIFLWSIWNVRECLLTVSSIVSIHIPVSTVVPWPFNNHAGRTKGAERHYQVSKVKLSLQIKLSTVTDNKVDTCICIIIIIIIYKCTHGKYSGLHCTRVPVLSSWRRQFRTSLCKLLVHRVNGYMYSVHVPAN